MSFIGEFYGRSLERKGIGELYERIGISWESFQARIKKVEKERHLESFMGELEFDWRVSGEKVGKERCLESFMGELRVSLEFHGRRLKGEVFGEYQGEFGFHWRVS